jgi:hypothetical protein
MPMKRDRERAKAEKKAAKLDKRDEAIEKRRDAPNTETEETALPLPDEAPPAAAG